MKLISDNEMLMSYVPNSIKAVSGEAPLLEKIRVHLQLAEDWLLANFLPEQTLTRISSYADSNPMKHHICQLVVAEALCRAVPSLDLVLTPNGFGVVNTNTVAAASKQRVDRLIGSLREIRDTEIEAVLALLPEAHAWLASEFADFFGATLFPNIDLATLCGVTSGRWEKYLELRSRCIDIEQSLAEDYFSPELMEELRAEFLTGSLIPMRKEVAYAIRNQIVEVLHDKPINGTKMRDIVNYIRKNISRFPKWEKSATAKLFSPPVFENKKNSPGYWF